MEENKEVVVAEENKFDIKNTLEIISASKYISVSAIKVLKDGAQLSDLRAFLDPGLFIHVKDAVKDSKLVALEVKDLSEEEKNQLILEFFEFVKAVAEAAK
jgi:hypothetical protein